jgi:ribosome-binding factor A
MSNRTVRINELVRREISDILRQDYQAESLALTITEVRVAPDLRDARVFVAVLGEEPDEKIRWLRKLAPAIRAEVGRRIVLKFLPRFEYVLDKSLGRSLKVLGILDEIERKEKTKGPSVPSDAGDPGDASDHAEEPPSA